MLKDEIKTLIKGEISDDTETLQKYSRDASIFEIKPQLVIFPKDTQDILQIVKFVNSHQAEHLSITCRAAGTDMSGGAIGDAIILDTKYLNQIIKVDDGYTVTQPGILYRDFEAETLKSNQLLPTYPASRQICTVGGMVANNAGGELNLTYGQLNKYVQQLKVILADGREYLLEPQTAGSLTKKIKSNTFEGQIYAKIYDLVTRNAKLIKEAKPKVSKNSTGYPVWDVWDGKTFDLSKLFIGSQGTLGIITEIKLRLIRPKPHQILLVINLPNLKELDKVIIRVLEFKPESFECYDRETLALATKFSSQLIKDFKYNNKLMANLRFLPEKLMSWTNSFPELVMLANFTSDSQKEALSQASLAQQNLKQFNLKSAIYDASGAEKYWIIRHKSFGLLRLHAQGNQASSFIDDIIVRPEFLPEFLPKLNNLIAPYRDKMVYTLAGHIGDGNFHIIPLMNLADPQVRQIIPELMEKVFDLVFKYQGSMSAEHNDGLIRGPLLPKMYGQKMFKIFEQIKQIFDPKNIFNPHKKTDSTLKYSLSHMINTSQSQATP